MRQRHHCAVPPLGRHPRVIRGAIRAYHHAAPHVQRGVDPRGRLL